jgi:hypothetical protein
MGRTDLGSSDVGRHECEDGDHADTVAEEEALQADDGSTQNVEDWGRCTRECENWTVYFRHVKYVNGEVNAMASDVSEAKTIAISDKISKVNIKESAVCGYRPKKGINITRLRVNGYSMSAAPAKNITHVSFRWCVHQVHSNGGKYATRPIAWATEGIKFSVRGYEVLSEPSEPSGTPGCFRRKPTLLLMLCNL